MEVLTRVRIHDFRRQAELRFRTLEGLYLLVFSGHVNCDSIRKGWVWIAVP